MLRKSAKKVIAAIVGTALFMAAGFVISNVYKGPGIIIAVVSFMMGMSLIFKLAMRDS